MDNLNNEKENKKSGTENLPIEILKAVLILALCAAGLLGLYYLSLSPLIAGKPYELEISGSTILPGKTTVAELADAGFSFSDYSTNYKELYDVNAVVKTKTKYPFVSLLKDGKVIADMTIINKSSNSKPLGSCLVSEVSFNFDKSYEGIDTTKLKGLILSDITPDKMSQVMGKKGVVSDYKSYSDTSPTGTTYTWSKGSNYMEISFSKDNSLRFIKTYYEK